MTGIIEGIILGVLGNAATTVTARAASRAERLLIGDNLLEKWKIEETALQPILQRAADALSETINLGGPARMEEVCLFLVTPDVEAILRQVYAAKILEDSGSLEAIRTKFLNSFAAYVEIEKEKLEGSSNTLFNALVEACEHTLSHAIDKGVLSAHEAKSNFRYQLLRDELKLVKENTEYLIEQTRVNVKAILSFEQDYRRQVAHRHGFITPPSFDTQQKVPIGDLYVEPNFVAQKVNPSEGQDEISYSDFVFDIYRSVVLGDPGGGKSTFTDKLCYDLARQERERLVAGRTLTPILVVLRHYGADKAAHGCSIVDFIERRSRSDYQLDPPAGAFKHLLLNSHCLVIFDGLDELLDTNRRREISADIESFCNYYQSVPVVVTSRKVGYDQAPLDASRFEVFNLGSFDDFQVEEYATNWFAVDESLTAEERDKKTVGFIKESRVAPDLRPNPLMLALMCNIYRRENHIPRNRPEVYRKCAEMLFERWDRDRGVQVQLRAEAHIKQAMMYLAHWIYTSEQLQEGVTERKLVAKMVEYLFPRFIEHSEEAELVAREFVEFCRGRAWVFSGVGRTAEDEELYKFTHRTFLEYFTAFQLVRTHRTPSALADVLLPRIAKKEWDNVAQLAFHLQEESVEGAWDELLDNVLSRVDEAVGDEEHNLLTFAARCLHFMVPSARMQRRVTALCLEQCIAWGVEVIKLHEEAEDYFPLYQPDVAEEIIGNLLRVRSENLQTVVRTFEQTLVDKINNEDEVVAFLALEPALHYELAQGDSELSDEVQDTWDSASDRIFDVCLDRIVGLCPQHLWLSVETFWRGKITIEELTSWHTVRGLFRSREYSMFPSKNLLPLAEVLTRDVLVVPYVEKSRYREERLKRLGDVGRFLLTCLPPWVNKPIGKGIGVISWESRFPSVIPNYSDWRFDETQYTRREQVMPLNLDRNALFGFFAIFVATIQTPGIPISDIVHWVKRSKFAIFDYLRWSLIAPYLDDPISRVQEEITRCGFTPEQQEFILKSARGELKLVKTEIITADG